VYSNPTNLITLNLIKLKDELLYEVCLPLKINKVKTKSFQNTR